MLRQNVVIGMCPVELRLEIARAIEARYGVRVDAKTSANGTELVAREIRKLKTLVAMREYLSGRVDAALEAGVRA